MTDAGDDRARRDGHGAMSPTPPRLPVTFRPYLARRVLLGLAVVVTAAIGVVTAILPPATAVGGFSTGDRLAMVAFAVLVLAGLWLLDRPRIRADESGLEVTNVFRRRRLEWAEVVAVSLRPGDPWLVLDLDDGSTLAAMGVQTSDGERARVAAEQVAALVVSRSATARDD